MNHSILGCLMFYFFLNSRHVIVLGDVNTAHKMIDHCDPDEKVINNPWSFCSNMKTSFTHLRDKRTRPLIQTSVVGQDKFLYWE